MSSASENTYGGIQLNERYKRLRRNLKMTLMKEAERQNTIDDNATWPNISSINGDNLDTSSTAISIYSKNGSEVVSSSTNMRKVLLHKNHKRNPNSDYTENIATSSVKQSPSSNDTLSRALMPPPNNIGILAYTPRKNSLAGTVNHQKNMRLDRPRNHNYGISSSSVYSSIKCPNTTNIQDTEQLIFEEETMCDTAENNHGPTDIPDRVFSKWRVMLNDKGQLIIKGTLECGKIARSKPVIQRLTAISVQSIYKHIYKLDGNIYDEKNELPDYIRGKFFNGFPDDWENVYQVWRNFITGGSNINFRWPTRITDSDDELKSEITEATIPPKIVRNLRSRSVSLKNRDCTEIHSQLPSDADRTLKNKEEFDSSRIQNTGPNCICNESINTFTSEPKIINDQYEKVNIASSVNSISPHDLNRSNVTSLYTPGCSTISLKDVLPADKIDIILANLNSKNCSIEYIDKIFQMYDCFRYIMSFKSETEHENESVKSKNISSNTESTNNYYTPRKSIDTTFTKLIDAQGITSHSVNNSNTAIKKSPRHDCENTSKRKANMMSGANRKPKIRRRSMKKNYESSDSYENSDSDDDTPKKSIRCSLRSHSKRGMYRKTSAVGRKLSQRLATKANDSEDDDYVPKETDLPPMTAPTVSNVQLRSNKIPTVNQQLDGRVLRSHPVSYEKVNSRRLQQENISVPVNHRHHRASSMSTIGGFLNNYDSNVSIIEDQHKNDDDTSKRAKSNTDYKGKVIDKRISLTKNSNTRNKHPYYDSSVSITEDEFSESNCRNNDAKKVILQESNEQYPQQMMKKTSTGMKHLPSTSQLYNEKFRSPTQSKIYRVEEVILNDNKENQSVDAGENRNKQSCSSVYPRELEMDEETIINQNRSKSISPEKKKNPTIVRSETPSIKLVSEVLTRSQSQKLVDSYPGECVNSPTAMRHLRPSKSFDDRKRTQNAPSDQSEITDKLKGVSESKSLTVILQDIKDATLNPEPINVKNMKTNNKKGVFGSETNPKRLSGWVLKVLQKSDNEYGLIFEGKLLNEADHVVNRKFTTDFISERIALKIIKTESNEYYQLVGDFTDTKHSMPKELQKLCFNGCPSKIPQFCEKWKKLMLDNSNSSGQLLNNSKDIENMPVSSRGRRIVPPLSYWTGERITLKDNQTVYSPGNLQNSSILSSDISRRDHSQNSSKCKDSSTKDTTISSKKNSIIDENNEEYSLEDKGKRANPKVMINKKQSIHQLNSYSSDSIDDDNIPSSPKKRRSKINYSKRNSENKNKNILTSCERELRESTANPVDIEDERTHIHKSSNRQNMQDKNSVPSASVIPHGVISYRYTKRIDRDSELSEDQISNF